MANEKLTVKFPCEVSEADNCICSACHNLGRVVKLKLPETKYRRDGKKLFTKYTEYWICLNCRKKLIELFKESLRYSGDFCGEIGNCKKCEYDKCGEDCGYAVRADYFIANGVTIQDDHHWATEQAYKNGYADGMPKWISVKDRLPENFQYALCIMQEDGDFRVLRWNYIDYMWNTGIEWFREKDVTHWMPLPPAPEDFE